MGGYNRIWQRTTIGTFAAGENATASAYIRGTSSGISVFLRLYAYDNSNNNIGNSADSSLALDSSWTRTQITYSNLPVNTSYVELDVFYSGIHNGDSADVYLDSAQIEKGDYATSYIPTTTAIAARNADTVTVPTTGWNQNAMTFFGVSGQISAPSLDHDIIRWPGNTINDRIYLENKNGTYGNSFGWVVLNGSGYNVIGPTKSTSGYMTSALSITPGATAIVYGDAIGGTPVSVVRLGGSLLAYAYVGSYNGLNQEFYNAPIQRLTIYLSALSSSDVSTVTNAIKDGP